MVYQKQQLQLICHFIQMNVGKQFSEECDFTFTTASTNYLKNNNQSEKAVGVIKNMLKKCQNDNVVDFEYDYIN